MSLWKYSIQSLINLKMIIIVEKWMKEIIEETKQ